MRKTIRGPDGHERTVDREREINLALASCFSGETGRVALDYLRSITTNIASGPEITTNALLHLEGQRFLVGVISQRINLGHREKLNDVNDQGKQGK